MAEPNSEDVLKEEKAKKEVMFTLKLWATVLTIVYLSCSISKEIFGI